MDSERDPWDFIDWDMLRDDHAAEELFQQTRRPLSISLSLDDLIRWLQGYGAEIGNTPTVEVQRDSEPVRLDLSGLSWNWKSDARAVFWASEYRWGCYLCCVCETLAAESYYWRLIQDLEAAFPYIPGAMVRHIPETEAPTGGRAIQPKDVLGDRSLMKKYLSEYNPDTGLAMYEAIPKAWKNWTDVGGRWGPGHIAKVAKLNRSTVSRYLGAFHAVGILSIECEGEVISIPHQRRRGKQ